MPGKVQDDDLVMRLVELALAQPAGVRETFVRTACGGDSELFSSVWDYVQWDERMQDFLLEPLFPPPSLEHPFEDGDVLEGRFRIVREVAQGGMGVVYEAFDQKLERRIALKCAKTGHRKRLPPEVRHAREISHPNVCKIFEIHTASTDRGEIDFLTMEFLEGETLSERLRRGRVPEAEARTTALQLCAGLAEAHRHHVIHGDLKSNNVILAKDRDGSVRAVITDFGLAREPFARVADLPLQTGPSDLVGGTPDYMAPELYRGEKASTASDIYALGVMLYELASGRRPFEPEVTWEQRLRLKPPAAHSKWNWILARCLNPDPARRFRSAEQVAQAISPPRTRRWILSAAAAAAVLAIITGTVTYQRATAPKESVRLALLPIEAEGDLAPVAGTLSREADGRLTHLTGGKAAKLSVIPLSKVVGQHADTVERARALLGATHVLHATIAQEGGNLVLNAVLTDARRRVNAKDWRVEYTPGQARYAPVALAGFVTGTLQLPPLVKNAVVNPAAKQDYWGGLWYLRRNATVDSALPLLERAVSEDPDSPLTYAALAEGQQLKFFVTGDTSWLDRAKESARQAQARNPDLAPVHSIVGVLRYREGFYDQAAAECRRAIELDPSNGDAHRRLGQAYDATGQAGEALAEYRRAIEVNPGDFRNHQQLGSFYYQRADYSQALPPFLKMVQLAPDEPGTHHVIGQDYLSLGQLPEAEHELRLAIRLGETPPELNTLSVVLINERKYSEAAAYLSLALSRGGDRLVLLMNLGTVYHLMNLQAASQDAYRRALDAAEKEMTQNPLDARARSYLAFVCASLGDKKRAESEIAQAQGRSPNDADVRFMAVATYEALGRRDDTLKVLSTASPAELGEISRWPDTAELLQDTHFLQLLNSHQAR